MGGDLGRILDVMGIDRVGGQIVRRHRILP